MGPYIQPWSLEGGGVPPDPTNTDMEGCKATDTLALPVQLRFSVALHIQRGELTNTFICD
jgi:hypothetical protein